MNTENRIELSTSSNNHYAIIEDILKGKDAPRLLLELISAYEYMIDQSEWNEAVIYKIYKNQTVSILNKII